MASNEGFGLGSLEALTAGTPIVVNVTGGLQDQCGFKKEDGHISTAEDYVELGSIIGEYTKNMVNGFPNHISQQTYLCQGSPLTPYIFDDRCSSDDAGEALRYWYDKGQEERSCRRNR